MSVRRSKRIPTKTRVIAAKKVRDKFRKEARAARKKTRAAIKIPRSLYLTEAEKEQKFLIKAETARRTEEALSVQDIPDPEHIIKLRQAIDTCDTFMEIVDFRDIEGSRCRPCEDLMKQAGKTIKIYLSNFNENLPVDYSHLDCDGYSLIKDIVHLQDLGNVCILGNTKSGKFLLSKEISARGANPDIIRICTPIATRSLSAVMRGACKAELLDLYACFGQIYPFLDHKAVADFFMIRPYNNMEDLLLQLGQAHSAELRQRRCMEAGALYFVNCLKEGRIIWAKIADQYIIKFN